MDEIPIDERYLYHFASMKLKQRGEDEFDEIASVNSDEFEMIMDRFEPGEANEKFDVNFSKMFGPEKTEEDKKSSKKRPADELDALDDQEDNSEDDVDDDEFMYSDDGEDDDLLNEAEDDEGDLVEDGDDEGDLVEDGDGEGEVDDDEEMENDQNMDSDEDEEEDYSSQLGYAKDALASVDKVNFSSLLEVIMFCFLDG